MKKVYSCALFFLFLARYTYCALQLPPQWVNTKFSNYQISMAYDTIQKKLIPVVYNSKSRFGNAMPEGLYQWRDTLTKKIFIANRPGRPSGWKFDNTIKKWKLNNLIWDETRNPNDLQKIIKTTSSKNKKALELAGYCTQQIPYLENNINFYKQESMKNRLYRPYVFYDVMGIFEEDLWKKTNYKPGMKIDHQTILNTAQRKNAIPQKNNFSTITLKELRKQAKEIIAQINSGKKAGPTQKANFAIIGYTKNNKKLAEHVLKGTDIRYLQAYFAKENQSDSLFQIASNLNALEGFMEDPGVALRQMQYEAVQGEEASLATMGATIVRKYCHPKTNFLKNIKNIAVENGRVQKINGILTNQDIEQIAFGFHKNVPVTSTFAPAYTNKNSQYGPIKQKNKSYDSALYKNKFVKFGRDPLNVFNGFTEENEGNRGEIIDVRNKSYCIDQAFVAALNLNPGHNLSYDVTKHEQTAQAILNAAYEATILWAFTNGKKNVFLTYLGCGAFKNKTKWVQEILTKNQNIHRAIAYGGLQVYIVNFIPNIEQLRTSNLQLRDTMLKEINKIALPRPSIKEDLYRLNTDIFILNKAL